MRISCRRLLLSWLVLGFIMNVYDYLVHDVLLLRFLYRQLPIMRYGGAVGSVELLSDVNVPFFIVADFIGAAAFVVAFGYLRRALPKGLGWSIGFGAVVGILMNIPVWWVCSMQLNGFPFRLAIAWTAAGLVWTLLAAVTTHLTAGEFSLASSK